MTRHPQSFQQTTFADQSEAEAFLSEVAESISAVRFEGEPDEFHMSYTGGRLGRCALHRGTHSKLSFTVTRADEFHIVLPLKRGVRFSGRHSVAEAVAGRTAMLLPPRLEGQCEAQPNTSAISFIASATSVAARAGDLMGAPVRLDSSNSTAMTLDLADPIVRSLARNVSSVFYEMQNLSDIGFSSLAAANFDDLLLGLASAIISPSVRSHLGGRAADPGTTIVRRAKEYIDAHAAEPLRLADLARALGVGLRSLQIAFRRHVGCSPREYLMNCRLQLARSRLLSPQPGTKVATVAFDCGFSDLAVFSAKYRQMFGELPSETLRSR